MKNISKNLATMMMITMLVSSFNLFDVSGKTVPKDIRNDKKVVLDLTSRNLLADDIFIPTIDNVKVSSQHDNYPGINAFKGDGINYWKNGSEGIYKKEFAPSGIFLAVDLGSEKIINGAYIALANEAKYLNLTLDKVNAKNLAGKFEIVYTSDKDIWDSLPESSNNVCDYNWQKEGWKLAGGTETEGLWSNTTYNDKDWAYDAKDFQHEFTARYVMVYISLIGAEELPPSTDIGLIELELFGREVIKNRVKLTPEVDTYSRIAPKPIFTNIDSKANKLISIELEISEEAEKNLEGMNKEIMLQEGRDYALAGDRVTFKPEYIQSTPVGDHLFVFNFQDGKQSVYTLSVTNRNENTVVINAIEGVSPFKVLGEGLGTDEPVEGATKRIRRVIPTVERHIQNLWDKELSKYVFRINAHDTDCNDGCYAHKATYNPLTGQLIDGDNSRQRIEIRPSTDSGMDWIAVEGDITKYSWKWRLAPDYPVGNSFNHIFQMKAVNAQRKDTLLGFTDPVVESGKAIFSFTAVNKGLQFRYNDIPVEGVVMPMDKVRGRWIEVSLEMLHSDNGWVKIKIEDVGSGELLMEHLGNYDTWRRPEQNKVGELDYPATYDQYNRPKWGIYRKGATTDTPGLMPTYIDFADLTITKVETSMKDNKQ